MSLQFWPIIFMYTFSWYFVIFIYTHTYIYMHLLYPGPDSAVFWSCSILSTKVLSKQNTGRSIKLSRGHLSCVTFVVMIPEAVPVGPLNRPKHAGSLRSRQETCYQVPSGRIYFNLHHWTSLWETSKNTYMEFLCQTCQLLRSKARENAFTCKLLLCMLWMPASGSTC